MAMVGLAGMLGACGGTTTTSANAGAQYLQMVGPANAARSQLYLDAAAAPPSEDKIRKDVKALYGADLKFNADLEVLAGQLTGNKKADLEVARGWLAKETVDLRHASTASDNYDWTSAMEAWANDRRSDVGAFNAVRKDLGLPPAGLSLS
jgi:hypothetical protein